MELYRGMSHYEINEWETTRIIPSGKRFTANQVEAEKLGYQHTLRGNVEILSIQHQDDLFKLILDSQTSNLEGTWYESTRRISLDEIIYQKHE
jgi:hypothetical protein